MTNCTFPGCATPAVARGYCRKHYDHLKNSGKLNPLPRQSVQDRFWSKVNKNGPLPDRLPELGPCWLWTRGKMSDGYGQFHLNSERPTVCAHIVAWEMENGPTPKGTELDHMCSRRLCVRPSHLRAVSRGTNATHLTGARSHSKIGVRGVKKVGNRYYARVTVDGVTHYAKGGHATAEEAGKVAAEMRRRLHPGNLLDR